jgi:hypothetical protein
MTIVVLATLLSIGLYGQWITDSAQNRVLPISNIPWDKYTHIIHFAAAPNSDGTIALHYLRRLRSAPSQAPYMSTKTT